MNHSILEHFVPIRVSDLVDFLTRGTGDRTTPQPLSDLEEQLFRNLTTSLNRRFHHDFNQHYRRLKDAYAPFDPDKDTVDLQPVPEENKNEILKSLYQEIRHLLNKANYRSLTKVEVNNIIQGASHWGLEMDVDWSVFDHIDIYYRGDVHDKRTLRRWWKLWIREEKVVSEYNRLVLVIRQKAHKRLGKSADTNSVFLKIFKDMPKADIEMVLPGSRVKLSKLDHGMIFYPVLSGVALILYKLLSDFFEFRDIFALGATVSLTWGMAAAFAGYGYKSYMSYSNKKTSYSLQLAQSLYYQGIDSNAGVFHRILDEAEEQEIREVLLAYFYLWKQEPGRGLTAYALDELIQNELKTRLNISVDFEIRDALEKLVRLRLARQVGDCFVAIPLQDTSKAVEHAPLEEELTAEDTVQWDVPLSMSR